MEKNATVTTPPPDSASLSDRARREIVVLEKSVYDFQKVRVAMGNRVIAAVRPDLIPAPAVLRNSAGSEETEPSEDEKKQQKELDSLLAAARKEYRMVTDLYAAMAKGRRGHVNSDAEATANEDAGDGMRVLSNVLSSRLNKIFQEHDKDLKILKSERDYRLVRNYEMALWAEKEANETLAKEVKKHPLWDAFFSKVHGCGPAMAAVCIAEIDIHKARWPASIWKYAGLDVKDGVGRNRSMFELTEYTDAEGHVRTKKGLGYNPFLKTKLIGVLGSSFLRAGVKPTKPGEKNYAQIYYDAKNRYEQRDDLKVTTLRATTKVAGTVKMVLPIGTRVAKGDVVAVIERDNGEVYEYKAVVDGMVAHVLADEGAKVAERDVIATYEKAGMNKLRIHRMATRYCVKMFLMDMWVAWRALEGYDVSAPRYEVAFLNRKPHGYNEGDERSKEPAAKVG